MPHTLPCRNAPQQRQAAAAGLQSRRGARCLLADTNRVQRLARHHAACTRNAAWGVVRGVHGGEAR